MERIKVAKNFYLDEFVDPVTYFTENDHGMSMIDKRLFKIAQLLRDKYKAAIRINGWWKHLPEDMENFKPEDFLKEMQRKYVPVWSGIRTPLCKIGAKYSAHKYFKAIDPKGNQKEFMRIVEENLQEFYKLGLRRIEDIKITKGWIHLDTLERNTRINQINVVGRKTIVKRIPVYHD